MPGETGFCILMTHVSVISVNICLQNGQPFNRISVVDENPVEKAVQSVHGFSCSLALLTGHVIPNKTACHFRIYHVVIEAPLHYPISDVGRGTRTHLRIGQCESVRFPGAYRLHWQFLLQASTSRLCHVRHTGQLRLSTSCRICISTLNRTVHQIQQILGKYSSFLSAE